MSVKGFTDSHYRLPIEWQGVTISKHAKLLIRVTDQKRALAIQVLKWNVNVCKCLGTYVSGTGYNEPYYTTCLPLSLIGPL